MIFSDEDGGIEMQVLGAGDPSSRNSAENNISNDISQANSAISIDYPEQVTSTIGLWINCRLICDVKISTSNYFRS